MKQTVADAIDLRNFFYRTWSEESPTGNMLECTEGDFQLRKTFDDMFQCLGRQVCKDHDMEDAFGHDPERTSLIPKEETLSDRAQDMYNAICLFVGLDPRK